MEHDTETGWYHYFYFTPNARKLQRLKPPVQYVGIYPLYHAGWNSVAFGILRRVSLCFTV